MIVKAVILVLKIAGWAMLCVTLPIALVLAVDAVRPQGVASILPISFFIPGPSLGWLALTFFLWGLLSWTWLLGFAYVIEFLRDIRNKP